MDNLYYMATTGLNMSDEVFWDSSLKFLFRQFDLHKENVERANKNDRTNKSSNKNSNDGDKVKLKVLSQEEIKALKERR